MKLTPERKVVLGKAQRFANGIKLPKGLRRRAMAHFRLLLAVGYSNGFEAAVRQTRK